MGVFGQALLVGAVAGALFLAALVLVVIPERRESADERLAGPYADLRLETPDHAAIDSVLFDENARGVPVLVHHYFRANTTPLQFIKILGALFLNLPLLGDMDVWTQTADSFENQLEYLKSEGYVSIGLDDLVMWQRGAKAIPERSVVITVDDADRSFLDHAFPMLERYGFEATVFVVTSQVGKRWEGVDCLTWDELRRLSDTGLVSVESHSHDLHRKVSTPEGRLPVFVAASLGVHDPAGYESWSQFVLDDLRASRSLIAEKIGRESGFLAWPYGFANGALDSLAVLAGFTSTCTMRMGMNRRLRPAGSAGAGAGIHERGAAGASSGGGAALAAWPRLELHRMTVTARTSMNGYRKMLSDDSESPAGKR
jgi:peptidoglycan/xylan/chitin deacetylase (PgdA/CDA1 family)